MGEDEEDEAHSDKVMEFVPIPEDESKVVEEGEEEEEKQEEAVELPGHKRRGTESQIMEEEIEEFMGGETEEMQVPQFHPRRTATYNLNASPRAHSEMKEDEESEELEEDEEDEEDEKEEFDETVRKYTKEQLLERFERAKL